MLNNVLGQPHDSQKNFYDVLSMTSYLWTGVKKENGSQVKGKWREYMQDMWNNERVFVFTLPGDSCKQVSTQTSYSFFLALRF